MSAPTVVGGVTGRPLEGRDPSEVGLEVIARDSSRNRTDVHGVVDLYFGELKSLPKPEDCRDAVLGKILKVPYKDPYMGLTDVNIPGTPNK